MVVDAIGFAREGEPRMFRACPRLPGLKVLFGGLRLGACLPGLNGLLDVLVRDREQGGTDIIEVSPIGRARVVNPLVLHVGACLIRIPRQEVDIRDQHPLPTKHFLPQVIVVRVSYPPRPPTQVWRRGQECRMASALREGRPRGLSPSVGKVAHEEAEEDARACTINAERRDGRHQQGGQKDREGPGPPNKRGLSVPLRTQEVIWHVGVYTGSPHGLTATDESFAGHTASDGAIEAHGFLGG